MKNSKYILTGIFSAALLLQGATGYKVVDRYPVPGNGGFDYITLDTSARRLYVSHGTQVDVLDADTGKVVGAIPDTPGVHGIAIAAALKHGFTSNGREDKVSMFDPSTLQLIKKIDVGKGPDGIYFDPASKRVFTNNHGSHDISAIDAATGEVVGTVKVEGDGESAVIGADGLIYVNLEDTSEVVAFDPESLQVKKRLPIRVAEGPTGLAYDPQTNRLFIGCRNKPMTVIMDAGTGKVITSFPIGAGVDFAGFDPQDRLFFFSCADGTLNIFSREICRPIRGCGGGENAAEREDVGVRSQDEEDLSAVGQNTRKPRPPVKRAVLGAP